MAQRAPQQDVIPATGQSQMPLHYAPSISGRPGPAGQPRCSLLQLPVAERRFAVAKETALSYICALKCAPDRHYGMCSCVRLLTPIRTPSKSFDSQHLRCKSPSANTPSPPSRFTPPSYLTRPSVITEPACRPHPRPVPAPSSDLPGRPDSLRLASLQTARQLLPARS